MSTSHPSNTHQTCDGDRTYIANPSHNPVGVLRLFLFLSDLCLCGFSFCFNPVICTIFSEGFCLFPLFEGDSITVVSRSLLCRSRWCLCWCYFINCSLDVWRVGKSSSGRSRPACLHVVQPTTVWVQCWLGGGGGVDVENFGPLGRSDLRISTP